MINYFIRLRFVHKDNYRVIKIHCNTVVNHRGLNCHSFNKQSKKKRALIHSLTYTSQQRQRSHSQREEKELQRRISFFAKQAIMESPKRRSISSSTLLFADQHFADPLKSHITRLAHSSSSSSDTLNTAFDASIGRDFRSLGERARKSQI